MGGRGGDLVLHPGQHPQLSFHRDVPFMGVIRHLAGETDVFRERMMRTVNHHRREARVDAGFGQFEGVAVVQVQGDGDSCAHRFHHFHRSFDQMGHHSLVHVFPGAARALENYGRFGLDAADDDGFKLLQIVEIVSRHGIMPGHGLSETSPGYSPARVPYNEIEPLSKLPWSRYPGPARWPSLRRLRPGLAHLCTHLVRKGLEVFRKHASQLLGLGIICRLITPDVPGVGGFFMWQLLD